MTVRGLGNEPARRLIFEAGTVGEVELRPGQNLQCIQRPVLGQLAFTLPVVNVVCAITIDIDTI